MIACPLPASSMDAGQADAIGMGIVWQAQGAIMGLAVEEAGTGGSWLLPPALSGNSRPVTGQCLLHLSAVALCPQCVWVEASVAPSGRHWKFPEHLPEFCLSKCVDSCGVTSPLLSNIQGLEPEHIG